MVDNSLRNLTGDWLRRVEERFAGVNGEGVKSLLQNFSSLNKSLPFVKSFFEAYPLAAEQLLAAEDIAYFPNDQGRSQSPSSLFLMLASKYGLRK
jgi:fatty acid synthase subunit alpha